MYLKSVMIGRYVLFNTNFWRCFLRNEFWSEKWIRNVRCYWIKLSKILLHRWINIWNGDFKMSKTKHWNILCDLGFDVRYDLIKCNPAWDWIKNWKKKKSLYFYIFITSRILCHFTSLIGHFILASVKRSKTIDLVRFQFQHPNDSKLKLYSHFIKRT